LHFELLCNATVIKAGMMLKHRGEEPQGSFQIVRATTTAPSITRSTRTRSVLDKTTSELQDILTTSGEDDRVAAGAGERATEKPHHPVHPGTR